MIWQSINQASTRSSPMSANNSDWGSGGSAGKEIGQLLDSRACCTNKGAPRLRSFRSLCGSQAMLRQQFRPRLPTRHLGLRRGVACRATLDAGLAKFKSKEYLDKAAQRFIVGAPFAGPRMSCDAAPSPRHAHPPQPSTPARCRHRERAG